MGWWDFADDALDLIGLGGPMGQIFDAVGGAVEDKFDKNDAPPATPSGPSKPSPSAPASPPSLPASPDGGQAAAAAQEDAQKIQADINQLDTADQNSDPVAAMQAAQAAATNALSDIQKQYQDKLAALQPRLKNNDAAALSELPGLANEAWTQTRQVLDEQNKITSAAAQRSQALAQHYRTIAPQGTAVQPGTMVEPGTTVQPGTAGTSAQATSADPYATMGSSNPMASMWPLMAMEMLPQLGSMGSNLMNSGVGGVTSALGTLGGLGSSLANRPPAEDAFHHDEQLVGNDKTPAAPTPPHDSTAATNTVADHQDKDGGKDGDGAVTKPASNSGHSEAGTAVPAGSSKEVPLPGGGTAHAETEQAATAARAVLNGIPILDAFQNAGLTVPPPGTPVTDLLSVSPNSLHAGDIAQFKDHQVLALGDGKVLISGQVVSQDQIGSSPDFMGWMRPVSGKEAPTGAPAHASPSPVSADAVS